MRSHISNDFDVLKEFYSIAFAKDVTFVNRAADALRLGCDYLGLHCGIISYVEGDRYTVLHVQTVSDEYQILSGDVFSLGLTYCKFTAEQKSPLAIHHVGKSEIAKHPSYEALKLEAYLGAATFLNDKLFGTVNFTSINPRDNAFTGDEIYFIQLVAEWISNQLDTDYRQPLHHHSYKDLSSRFETSPLAVIEMTPKFKVTKWNETAELILGWREEQVMNKAPRDWPIVDKNDVGNLISLFENLQNENEKDCAFFCDLRKNNGQHISTEWILTCIDVNQEGLKSIRAHILDITERVQTENKLLRKSAIYQDLFQNAPDMYLSLDQSGNIISVNETCNRILGYTATELVGTPYWSLLQKDDVRRIRRLIDVAFSGDVEELEMEANILKKDDSVIKSHQKIRIIQARKGMPRELRIIARDMTERKRGQANRIEHLRHQRDEISLEVQHRIKNSLQAVIGMLTVSVDAHPELKPILTTSIAQIRAISIVNALIMDGKDDVDLLSLLDSLVQASSELFNYEIQFNKEVEDNAQQMLVADEVIAMSLVITEILINALKHRNVNVTKEDYICINATSKIDGVNVEVVNTCKDDNDDADGNSHLGMSMIASLLPPEGAELNVSNVAGIYTVVIDLKEPTVVLKS